MPRQQQRGTLLQRQIQSRLSITYCQRPVASLLLLCPHKLITSRFSVKLAMEYNRAVIDGGNLAYHV